MTTTIITVDKTLPVAAPAAALWSYATDWSRHGEWIPLTRTETVGGDARGVGGRFRAWSGIGPIGFWDPMTVTHWEEHPDGSGFAAVVHTGRIVKGDAEITVTRVDDTHSTLRWVEHLHFSRPGLLAWRVGGRFMDAGLDKALADLVRRVEAQSAG